MSPELEAKLGEAMLAHALREGKVAKMPATPGTASTEAREHALRLHAQGWKQSHIAVALNRSGGWVSNVINGKDEAPA